MRPALPGFRLTLGVVLLYTSLIVLLPLAALGARAGELGLSGIWAVVSDERAVRAYGLSFGAALVAALINAVLGLLLAWVLVRYRFPGRRLVDGLIDLPFALPTAVAGIALTAIYSPKGMLGGPLAELGLQVAFTRVGITVALVFIGIPFVVRTVQPVLEGLDPSLSEAAQVLGASRLQTFFRVIFPALLPATLTGFALALARGVGEYGSVVFISGNMPYRTEVASLLIITKLEQYDYEGATALAAVMLLVSFAILLGVNLLQRRLSRGLT